jgi:hypothetical protein
MASINGESTHGPWTPSNGAADGSHIVSRGMQCTIPAGAIPDECRMALAMCGSNWSVDNELLACAPR